MPAIFCLLLDKWWYVGNVVPAKGDARGWLRFRDGISSMLSECVFDHFTRNQRCGLGDDEGNSRRAIENMSTRIAFMLQSRLRNIAHDEFQWPFDKKKGLPVQRNIEDESIENIAVDILSTKEDTDDSVGVAKTKATTKRKPKRKNEIIDGDKPSFELPFYPPMSQADIVEADRLRNIDEYLGELGDSWRVIPPHECYSGGPIYKLVDCCDGEIDQGVELLEDDYAKLGIDVNKKGTHGTFSISYKSLKTLENRQFVNDEIINGFSAHFNKRQALKYTRHKSGYRPGHMFSTHFIPKLCFKNNKPQFQVDINDRWLNKSRVPKSGCRETACSVEGATDIFKCERLLFPMNEGNLHWVVFSINPNTLCQKLYDSLHGGLDEKRIHVSSCLYRWMLHEHRRRYGKAHLKETVPWSQDCILSSAQVLGNSSQGSTVDCALHTIVVPVLLQDKEYLDVFGKNHDEQVKAGIEMRRRVVLTLSRGDFMFETRPASQKEKNGRLVEQ